MAIEIKKGRRELSDIVLKAADDIENMYSGFLCTHEEENGKCSSQCGDCKRLEK